jgi:hypothetical protein
VHPRFCHTSHSMRYFISKIHQETWDEYEQKSTHRFVFYFIPTTLGFTTSILHNINGIFHSCLNSMSGKKLPMELQIVTGRQKIYRR